MIQGTGRERARNNVICLERARDVGQSMALEVGQVTSPVPSLLCSPTGRLLAGVGAVFSPDEKTCDTWTLGRLNVYKVGSVVLMTC